MAYGIKFTPYHTRTWDKELKGWLEKMETRQEYLRKRYRETDPDDNPTAPPLTDEEVAEYESIQKAIHIILRGYQTPQDKEAREIIRRAARHLSDDAAKGDDD